MVKLSQTTLRIPVSDSAYAQGSSTRSWRMTLIHRLFMPSPIAWNTDEKAMSTPARAKLREMIRSAY